MGGALVWGFPLAMWGKKGFSCLPQEGGDP